LIVEVNDAGGIPVTRVNKPSNKMVTPNLAPLTLERSALPKAGCAHLASSQRFAEIFRKDERGSTAMMFGLLVMPIMFLTGMAVDYSRMITVKQRMQTAVDAAALAGVRAAQANTTSASAISIVTSAAQTYYNGMTKGKLPFGMVDANGKLPPLEVTESTTSNTFTVKSNTWVRTPFLSINRRLRDQQVQVPEGHHAGIGRRIRRLRRDIGRELLQCRSVDDARHHRLDERSVVDRHEDRGQQRDRHFGVVGPVATDFAFGHRAIRTGRAPADSYRLHGCDRPGCTELDKAGLQLQLLDQRQQLVCR
jgi:Flp pilus assembly protein TadG